jgi:hypothetical protein
MATNRYQHSIPPEDYRQLLEYIERELASVSAAIDSLANGEKDVLHSPPKRVYPGLKAIADGSDWDPDGSGIQGEYLYTENDEWVRIGPDPDPVPFDPTEIEEKLNDVWRFKAIGEIFPLWTHLDGVETPPTDNPDYRYIKLTASDSYNAGVLTSESVSGSAPLVQATAVIDDPDSPMNGETVRLINTERRVIRAGSSGTVEADAIQNITGSVTTIRSALSGGSTGAFGVTTDANFNYVGTGSGTQKTIDFDASRVARTANETRAKNIGADYFMRIR